MNDQVVRRDYSTSVDCAREPVRKGWDRRRMRDRLLTGAASPRGGVADARYFDRLRAGVREGGHR